MSRRDLAASGPMYLRSHPSSRTQRGLPRAAHVLCFTASAHVSTMQVQDISTLPQNTPSQAAEHGWQPIFLFAHRFLAQADSSICLSRSSALGFPLPLPLPVIRFPSVSSDGDSRRVETRQELYKAGATTDALRSTATRKASEILLRPHSRLSCFPLLWSRWRTASGELHVLSLADAGEILKQR